MGWIAQTFHWSLTIAFRLVIASFGRFYTKEALSVWTNLDKHFLVHLVIRL